MNNSHPKYYAILSICILIWGLNWTILKLAVGQIPAIWLGAILMGFGSLIFFIMLTITGQLKLPTKKDLPLVFTVGIFQFGAFLMFMNLGLMYIAPGRGSIIAYTTPLWVIPMACLFYREKLPKLKVLGLILGVASLWILLDPPSMNWQDMNNIKGDLFLLAASWCWAITMVHIRYGARHLTAMQIIPWQMLVATIFLIIVGLIFQPHPQIIYDVKTLLLLLYIVPFATVIANWALMVANQNLPAISTSFLLLAVPVSSLAFAHFLLHEAIDERTFIAMCLLLLGMVLITLADNTA